MILQIVRKQGGEKTECLVYGGHRNRGNVSMALFRRDLLTMGNYVLKSIYIHTYIHTYIHRALFVLLSVCGKLKHPTMTYGTVP